MGVNAIIMMPADTRIKDVADVIGILAGLPARKEMLDSTAYACQVSGVKVKPSSMAEMATIEIHGNLIDGETNHYTTWHWEPDCGTGERLIYPRSNPFWIAVGIRLVDFFGGSIVYNDCGDMVPNYSKKQAMTNNPTNGEPWQKFQDAKLAVKPLTQDELETANGFAAYKKAPYAPQT